MTEQQITDLGPAFARFLGRCAPFFDPQRTRGHFRDFCRGRLSDRPRKSAEPIAPAAGTAARTRQAFLTTAPWDHLGLRDDLQRRLAEALPAFPADGRGTVGISEETSALKTGTKTPGVQRQHRGGAGAVDNGLVTVHLAVARGRFKARLDADLYRPPSWDADRDRGRAAQIPDTVRYPPKWPIALGQRTRAARHGLRFDGRTFDEGYGGRPRLRALRDVAGPPYVAEVPVALSCRRGTSGKARRADDVMAGPAARREPWRRFRRRRPTEAAAVWEAKALPIRRSRASPAQHRRVMARNVRTDEVKYVVTNAGPRVGPERGLRVAFVRGDVEPCCRVAKSEIGRTHVEGRSDVGLMRHRVLSLTALAFVALHTERRRGEKPGGDAGAGVPGVERPVRGAGEPAAGDRSGATHGDGHHVSPAAERGRAGLEAEA